MAIIDPFDAQDGGIVDPFDTPSTPKRNVPTDFNFGGVSLKDKPRSTLDFGTPRQKEEAQRVKPGVKALFRTGIEGTGAALGAAAGGGLASIPLAGAGYAGGKRVADALLGDESDNTLGGIAKDVAIGGAFQAGGMVLGSQPVRSALSAIGQAAPKKMYESAMKFSNNPKVLAPVERRAAINTGLEGGFLPREKDYERLWATVNSNRGKVENIINQGAQAGDVIDTARALRPLSSIKRRFDLVRDQHPELAEVVDDVMTRYSQTPTIGVKEAQTLKETLQDISTFAADDRSKAANRAYKAVGRGLRMELERIYPDLAKINKQSSSLLTLENELAKAVGRIGNRDITSLGLRVALGGSPGPVSATNTILSVFEMPRVKARLAVALYKAQTGRSLPVSQWRKAASKVFPPGAIGSTNVPTDERGNE